jgi:hypothetical protein
MAKSVLDDFIARPDAREHHAVTVRAPADLVYRTAIGFDFQSIPLVRAIFWSREKLMGARSEPRQPRAFIEEARAIGWGCLVEHPGELFVAGAVCQPWLADVTFRSVPADRFARFAEPDQVKIAWTLEALPLGPARSRLVTETRAAATDTVARAKFMSYWRWARFGIYSIRWLVLPAIKHQAEANWRDTAARSVS